MSETLRCVWIVSNWSKHQSNSSIVSIAKRTYDSSPGAKGLANGVAAALFDLHHPQRTEKNEIAIRMLMNVSNERF